MTVVVAGGGAAGFFGAIACARQIPGEKSCYWKKHGSFYLRSASPEAAVAM